MPKMFGSLTRSRRPETRSRSRSLSSSGPVASALVPPPPDSSSAEAAKAKSKVKSSPSHFLRSASQSAKPSKVGGTWQRASRQSALIYHREPRPPPPRTGPTATSEARTKQWSTLLSPPSRISAHSSETTTPPVPKMPPPKRPVSLRGDASLSGASLMSPPSGGLPTIADEMLSSSSLSCSKPLAASNSMTASVPIITKKKKRMRGATMGEIGAALKRASASHGFLFGRKGGSMHSKSSEPLRHSKSSAWIFGSKSSDKQTAADCSSKNTAADSGAVIGDSSVNSAGVAASVGREKSAESPRFRPRKRAMDDPIYEQRKSDDFMADTSFLEENEKLRKSMAKLRIVALLLFEDDTLTICFAMFLLALFLDSLVFEPVLAGYCNPLFHMPLSIVISIVAVVIFQLYSQISEETIREAKARDERVQEWIEWRTQQLEASAQKWKVM